MMTDPAVSPDLVASIVALGTRGLGVEGSHIHLRGHEPLEHHWVADIRRDVFAISKTFISAPLPALPSPTAAPTPILLSRIVHACSGQDLRDYLLPRLFAPLGIDNPQWLRCPLGYSLAAVGALLRAEVHASRPPRTIKDRRPTSWMLFGPTSFPYWIHP